MMPRLRQARAAAIEALYPRTCAGCGMRGTWLCDVCEAGVPQLEHGICFRCGAPAVRSCRTCLQLDRSIAMARSAYPYAGWVRAAVHRSKYTGEWDRLRDMGVRMAPMLRVFGDLDGIVPVPLHPSRMRQRGYNQAALLAQHLEEATGIPVMPLLERTRETPSQVDLDRDARAKNVQRAFALNPRWAPDSGLRLLIVDDVRTTSATVNACASMLIRTAPASMHVATFALDVHRSPLAPWLADRGAALP